MLLAGIEAARVIKTRSKEANPCCGLREPVAHLLRQLQRWSFGPPDNHSLFGPASQHGRRKSPAESETIHTVD